MTHVRITNGDGYYCSRCGVSWDRDESEPEVCSQPDSVQYHAPGAPRTEPPLTVFAIPHPQSAVRNMTQTPDPMAIQIGGNHYKKFPLQPTEFCMRNGLDPCIHAVVKYVARWREKGGIEDLKKAIHYIQIREKFWDTARGWGSRKISMVEFVQKNGIGLAEAEVLYRLETYYAALNQDVSDGRAQRVIEAIEAIIRAEEIKTA